ncbi:MAG: aminomethyl transferase family protein [Ignavibacteria bacterium]|jgi:folate-binding protein YgfZ|nr:aminomethyl transferase family protein [Ignavibacteria bacterium]MCU7498693.1 aminomethyl transferase family protein [Ignavibacteria bacterium]MCU7513906.1 aminomethyl transferase family protein [Ignavibacteria bacterium]MCU7519243.1 aminomethyl transferase family protein [Ignavibacteria bacterium]MCU7525538.1 aminomethyl transferase family protein [Ignavibacteria bacterium]
MPDTVLRISPMMDFFKSVYQNIVLDEPGSKVSSFTGAKEEYEALTGGVALRDISDSGLLELYGRESLEYLHRISTNSLIDLPASGSQASVFTNEKGRIIDRVRIVNLGEYLLLIGSPAYAGKLQSWINRYIIMEDIKVKNAFGGYSAFELLGPQAESFLTLIFGSLADNLEFNSVKRIEAEGIKINILKVIEFNQKKFILWGSVEEGINLLKHINTQDSVFDFRMAGEEAYKVFRVVKGIPAAPNEINDMYNPHETNLLEDVSFKKGCYIGQEVIARLDTYDKVQKSIAGLIFDEKAEVKDGFRLFNAGNEVGKVTTMARSFHLEKEIALSIISKNFSAPGIKLTAMDESGKEYSVTVCSLPLRK